MILSFEQPKKLRDSKTHNEMFMSDSGVDGTYVPNMSKEDRERWKGKHITGENERIEIKKTIDGVQLVIIIRKNKPVKYTWENKEYDKQNNIKISMNGSLWMTFEQQKEMVQVIEEAKELLGLK